MSASIVWFRQDLRLSDHPALAAAIRRGEPVVPVYLWAPAEEGDWKPGGATRWWLHHALADLDKQLRELGSRLLIRECDSSLAALRELVEECGADGVYWNRRYEPAVIERDKKIKSELRETGLEVKSFNSGMLFEPHEIANKSGKPFQVFTPMWKHYQTLEMPQVVDVDLAELKSPKKWPGGSKLEDLALLPSIVWDGGFYEAWDPTRAAMIDRLDSMRDDGRAKAYLDDRDTPSLDGTSALSPFLHSGQVGVREAWWKLGEGSAIDRGLRRQLIWREFAHHLLFHFPVTPLKPLRPEFEMFPWKEDAAALSRWQRGETGYPIVDAGMRQLWHTGWMHNRVRMIVGSLLVKHLLVHWLEGAKWFWDTLVDADLANNTLGWQWIGGCGADAAPYFRIFNPMTQGEKFDTDAAYVRQWVPELKRLPDKFIHRPWEMGELELSGLGVVLGLDYPLPVIGHTEGRQQALDAFAILKARRQQA
ncbi:MAG: deoxyribodipyrimidine photo-lyase [Verrucomicrobiales bacterium]|jgi:deoxyribodipyrimidine photo-lyase